MFKRLFFAMVGLGAGVALGVYGLRKIEAAQQRLRPEHMANQAALRAGGLRLRVEEALAQGRRAAAAKEAELRAVYRVHQPEQPPAG